LGAGTLYLVSLINTKKKAIEETLESEKAKEYLNLLNDTITSCVLTTTQTYVQALKEAGTFDAEAQKIAFNKTYTAVMAILTEDAKEYLGYALGDLEVYVTNKIEATVTQVK
jgi:hypothetical protein